MADMPSEFYIPAFGFLVGTGSVIIGALWRELKAERAAKDVERARADAAQKEATTSLNALTVALTLNTEAIKAIQNEALRLFQAVVRDARKSRDAG